MHLTRPGGHGIAVSAAADKKILLLFLTLAGGEGIIDLTREPLARFGLAAGKVIPEK